MSRDRDRSAPANSIRAPPPWQWHGGVRERADRSRKDRAPERSQGRIILSEPQPMPIDSSALLTAVARAIADEATLRDVVARLAVVLRDAIAFERLHVLRLD